MEDLDIIELYFARNEQAIKETEKKYGTLCKKIAYNILNNNEDAEECVNDTYVGLWNAIPPKRPGNLKAFVCGISRNLSLKRIEADNRKKRSREMIVSLEELSCVLPDDNVCDGIGEEDIGKAISRFLRNEREIARNVFIRKYYFFDSVADIARHYGFTESKVKNMLFHTRSRLKEYLIKEGIEV